MTSVRRSPRAAAEGEPEPLAIFRLVPTAARNDRRFARDAFHGEVVVRARSADDARIVAAEAEGASAGTASGAGSSPFLDGDSYTVVAVSGAGFLQPGKRGLIAGRFAKAVAG